MYCHKCGYTENSKNLGYTASYPKRVNDNEKLNIFGAAGMVGNSLTVAITTYAIIINPMVKFSDILTGGMI